MAVSTNWYSNGPKHLALGTVDWTDGNVKVILVNGYVFDQDAHEFYDDVTGELTTGNGYTAGGLTLASPTVTVDTATNQTRLDGTDPSWTAGSGETLTADGAVILYSTGVAATSPLLGYINFDGDQSSTNAAFTVQLDATGALRITAS